MLFRQENIFLRLLALSVGLGCLLAVPVQLEAQKAQPRHHAAADEVEDTGLYTNSQGNIVHRPAHASQIPSGATAICRDNTYSFSQSRRGTCSHHGGVASWF